MSRAVPGVRTLRTPCFLVALALAALAGGCLKGEVGQVPAQVITHPDLNCNTAPDAEANSECRLTLGQETQEYIQQQADQDWWVVNVGTLPPRAIVHVVAGYKPGAGQDAGSFNTAVNLQINVLDSSNGTVGSNIVSAKDVHGSNPPSLLDVTFRYTKSNNDLFILVQDDNGKKYDNLSPYTIKVEVIPDPDANEANDTPATATPITLSSGSGGVQGNGGGYLATPGDLDYYSIVAANPNSVMWIRVGEDPAAPSPPPHRYRLEYFLRDPGGNVVATDSSSAGSQVSQALVQIGTARLLQSTGTYTLEVRAYIDPNNQTVIPPGDLAFKYKVEVIIVPLQDPAEPNNSIADAKAKPTPDLSLAGPGLLRHDDRPSQLRPRPGLLPGPAGGGDRRPDAPALQGDAVRRTSPLSARARYQGPGAHRHHRGRRGRAGRLCRGRRGGVHHQRLPGHRRLLERRQPLRRQWQLTAAVPAVRAVRELQHPAGVPPALQLRVGPSDSAHCGQRRLLLQVRGRGQQLGGRHRLHHHRRLDGRARRRRRQCPTHSGRPRWPPAREARCSPGT